MAFIYQPLLPDLVKVPLKGGGHSGTEWIPTTKRLHGTEAMNSKIEDWSAHFKANKGLSR